MTEPDIGTLLATAKVLKIKGDEYTASMLEQCAAALRNARGEREVAINQCIAKLLKSAATWRSMNKIEWPLSVVRAEECENQADNIRALLTDKPTKPVEGIDQAAQAAANIGVGNFTEIREFRNGEVFSVRRIPNDRGIE